MVSGVHAGKVGCACTHVFQTLGWVIGAGGYCILYADDSNLIFMNIIAKLSKNRRTIEVVYLQSNSFLSSTLP